MEVLTIFPQNQILSEYHFKKSLNDFWLGLKQFPTIFDMARNILLSFFTIYLCQAIFSALKFTKSKYQVSSEKH